MLLDSERQLQISMAIFWSCLVSKWGWACVQHRSWKKSCPSCTRLESTLGFGLVFFLLFIQPLQLSDQLHTVLLALCEDKAHKRPSPESILETCRAHQQRLSVQVPASVFVQRLIQCALGSIREVSISHLFLMFPARLLLFYIEVVTRIAQATLISSDFGS